jgi:hypothetical protein
MQWHKIWSEALLKRTKTILEIISIPVAAWWAFTRFAEGERPSLEYRADVQNDVTWVARSPNDCIAHYDVTIKNIGKTSFDVTSGQIGVWTFDDLGPFSRIDYIDPYKLMERKKPVRQVEVKGDLLGHYAPDVSASRGFTFGVERKPGDVILFSFEAQSAKKSQPPWHGFSLEYVCGEPPGLAKPKLAH